MKRFLISGLYLFILTACTAQQQKPNHKQEDNLTSIYPAKQLERKLEELYNQRKTDSLDQFFTGWNKTVQPNTEAFIHQNDTVNAVFGVYKAIYKPFNLLQLGDWEWGNKLNENCRYVVVQN